MDRVALASLALVPALLALAAAQPALTSDTVQRTRTDAAVFTVFDISRSMLAARSAGGASRLARAKTAAMRIRAQLPEMPFGVATITDRLLPVLFPTADQALFDTTVRQEIRIDDPPPLALAPNATDFSTLGNLGTQSFFPQDDTHRAVLIITDGESRPFAANALPAQMPSTPVVVIRIWHRDERVFSHGRPEPGYRPDPASKGLSDDLAHATGGHVFGESNVTAAATALRQDLGSGSTASRAIGTHRTPLAPWLAAAALVPLGLLLRRRLLLTV